ncbi:hypothetical protein Tco_1070150 [Tanacetum coccineum]|uniref:Uncharacterized protein n=1 Tax=Tanacetum coccineum TaxID=301880 RepID=A0ABQ5HMR6_9ASTR
MDTAYGRRWICRIWNCEYAFSCEDLALIRRISFPGYDVLILGGCFRCAGKKPDEASGSGVVSIDMNDPLYLHSNDTNDPETQPFLAEQWERCNSVVLTWILNCVSPELFIGQVFSSNAKQIWDELTKTYDKIDGSVIFNLHYKINTVSQNGSKLSDYYHKLNSLWKEYDVMVQLPICTCDGAGSYKDHVQLLKLMQFVMGLDDAFSHLSRDESHRTMHDGGSGVKGSTSAFNSIPSDNKGNNTSFVPRSGDNKKRFNNSNARNPNLLCKNCNMTSHTIERCFELIGYPPNFKKRSVSSQNVTSNGSVKDKDTVTGTSTSHTLTSEQYQRLMSLLSDRFWNWCSEQYCRTIAKVNQIGSYKLNDKIVLKDVLVVPGYQVSLLSVHQLVKVNKMSVCFNENDCIIQDSLLKLGHPADQVLSVLKDKIDLNGIESVEPVKLPSSVLSGKYPYELVYKCQPSLSHLSEPYDDERDPSDSGGTKSSPVGPVVESASADPNSTSDPSASTSESCAKGDDSASLNDDDLISEGEGLDLYKVDLLFHEDSNENITDEGQSVRRSSWKSVLPAKLKDYVVDGKVKKLFLVVNGLRS